MHLDQHQIQEWLTAYGYGGLSVLLALGIVGLPMPDETLLTLAGSLAQGGQLELLPTVTAGFLGSAVGITISFAIGRTVGVPVLERYGPYLRMTPARIEQVHVWFRGVGHWGLFLGYFVPGLRHFTALVAGLSMLEWSIFATYAYSGALVWSLTFILIGFYVGPHWHAVLRSVNEHRTLAVCVIAALLVAYLAVRRANRRRPR